MVRGWRRVQAANLCIMLVVFLFSKFKNQKKAFILKNKIQIQIQIQKTNLKTKLKNINKKQQTTNINYKLLMMIDAKH